jgi:glutamyl/glutaminyl-tRNA synthetase
MNGAHIRLLSLDVLMSRVEEFWPDEAKNAEPNYKKQVLALAQDRLKTLADLPLLTSYFFAEPTPNWEMAAQDKQLEKIEKAELKILLEKATEALEQSDFNPTALQNTLNQLLETTSQKPGILFSLIRLAVSWAPFSPALNETLAVLGKGVVLARLNSAINTIK